MTTTLITDAPTLSAEDTADLARLRDLERELGRFPGRPLVMKHLDVTDSRARKLISLARDTDPRTHAGSGRTSAVRHLAPAGGLPFQVVPPAGATPPDQANLPGESHQAAPLAPARGPDPQPVAPGGDPTPPIWRHATNQPATTSATTVARQQHQTAAPAGARGFYTVAFMSMLVSIDTSWRFFEHNLHITDLRERVVMFAVLEVALLACGWGMRANVQRTGRPGAPRLFAWLLCGMAAYMAWQLSGVAAGLARVALGPALGLVMLHLALGIEVRARHATTTTWARIGREFRERLLSRLGLSDDERDALARTRDRAARSVARLALAPKWTPFRQSRLDRNLRKSNVAHDPAARDRMLAELAAIRHAGDLSTLPQPSPWLAIARETEQRENR